MKHNDIKIGQTVYHNFSNTKGVVSGKRLKKPYTICVFWEDGSFREDWYKPEVLTNVEGAKLMPTLSSIQKIRSRYEYSNTI